MLFIASLLAIVFLGKCSNKDISFQAGTFELALPLHAPKYQSTLTLNNDGTFEQTVVAPSGVASSAKGKWKRQYRAVRFDHFLYLVELNRAEWSENPLEVWGATATIAGDYLAFGEEPAFAYLRSNSFSSSSPLQTQ